MLRRYATHLTQARSAANATARWGSRDLLRIAGVKSRVTSASVTESSSYCTSSVCRGTAPSQGDLRAEAG